MCKLSMHKEAHAPPFSCQEWIKIGWLAFEFKFDLNSSEQPPSFILSRGENAVKMRSCTVLKRKRRWSVRIFDLREKGWREKGSLLEKRKEKNVAYFSAGGK